MEQKNLFERIFSIDELKFSGLTLVLFILVGFAGYEIIKVGDVPSNLTGLIEICVGAIAGVNAFSFVGNNFGMSKNQNAMMPMQNQYGSQYGYSNSYSPYGNSSTGMNQMPINNSMIPSSNISPIGQPLANSQQLNTGEIDPTTRGI